MKKKIFLFFCLIFLISISHAFAADIEVYPVITNISGAYTIDFSAYPDLMTGAQVCTGSTSSLSAGSFAVGTGVYKNSYPDTSTFYDNNGGLAGSCFTGWTWGGNFSNMPLVGITSGIPSGYADGSYWQVFKGSPNNYYWNFTISGGVLNGDTSVPPNYTTRFTSITVSTSTQTVNLQGYWNASGTPLFNEIEFYQYSNILGQESYITETATTSGNFNWSFPYLPLPTPSSTGTTTPPVSAETDFYANLYQIDNSKYNDPLTNVIDPLYQILLDSTTTSLSALTGYQSYDLSSTTAILNYPEYECDITSITGCIKNAAIWLFYPSSDTINNYENLLPLISTKSPAGYFVIVKNSILGLSATGTPTTSVTIPKSINDVIFNPFDEGIAAILWIYFIFNFYKRLKHIQL